MLPFRLRRAVSVSIPIFTGLALVGVISGIFGIDITENIANTGIEFGTILGILNLWLAYLVYKHQVP